MPSRRASQSNPPPEEQEDDSVIFKTFDTANATLEQKPQRPKILEAFDSVTNLDKVAHTVEDDQRHIISGEQIVLSRASLLNKAAKQKRPATAGKLSKVSKRSKTRDSSGVFGN